MTLNMELSIAWNDWRLMYVENGVSCKSAAAAVFLAGSASADAAAYAYAEATAALLATWNCSSATDCDALPSGVLPSVEVSVDEASQTLTVTVFPATPQPGDDPSAQTDAFSAALDAAWAAYPGPGALAGGADGSGTAWVWTPVQCTGADARVLPPAISLAANVGAATMGGTADPTSLDPYSMWDPEVTDSVNQVSDQTVITETWHVAADGSVEHKQHFLADFRLSMRLESFPFDKPYFIATRRATYYMGSDIALRATTTDSFVAPQQIEGWELSNSGTLVCSVLDEHGGDVRPCPAGQERSGACQDMIVLYFQATRDSAYYTQNELAPIVLVTIMAAAAYFNDLDAYETRGSIMATALLSQMALQAYVSSTLPQTVSVTFIHMALYTSYALMGFGMVFIVVCSYGMGPDIQAARKGHEAAMVTSVGRHLRQHRRKTWRRMRALVAGGDDQGCKHWQALEYFAECATMRAIMDGEEVEDTELVHFPNAELYAPRRAAAAAVNSAARGARKMVSDLDGEPAPAVDGDEEDSDAPPPPPHIPGWLRLKEAVVKLDYAMRTLHLGVFALVMACSYFTILRRPEEHVSCDNLQDFYALK